MPTVPEDVEQLMLADADVPGVIIDRYPLTDWDDCPLSEAVPLVRCACKWLNHLRIGIPRALPLPAVLLPRGSEVCIFFSSKSDGAHAWLVCPDRRGGELVVRLHYRVFRAD